MENTSDQQGGPDASAGSGSEEPRGEAAARAVARMLANPRRIRRD